MNRFVLVRSLVTIGTFMLGCATPGWGGFAIWGVGVFMAFSAGEVWQQPGDRQRPASVTKLRYR